MADSLIFGASFDFSKSAIKGEKDAEKALKRIQDLLNTKPLTLELKVDTTTFKTLGKSYKDNIDNISESIRALEDKWNSMSNNLKFNADGTLSKGANDIINKYKELTVALETYGQSLSQIVAKQKKDIEAQIREEERKAAAIAKNAQKNLETLRLEETTIANLTAKYKFWQEQMNRTEVGSKAFIYASEQVKRLGELLDWSKKEANELLGKMSKAKPTEIEKLRAALAASEQTLEGLNARLKVFQDFIQGRTIGSDIWNRTALEIRRITEELTIANQRMQDFQQKAFQGLGNDWATLQVQKLTRLREQLRLVDEQFNRLNQSGGAYDSKGGLTDAANIILKQRMQLTKEINEMLKTGVDAQLQREKEINKIVEQRKAKADAIAAKKAEETRQTQANIARLKEERAILNKQENSIANITAKLQIQQQRLNSAQFGSKSFDNAIKEVERLSKKLQEAQREIDNLTGKADASANRQVQSLKKVTNEYGRQEAYLRNLTTRIATYASIGAMGAFLQRVRDVTAEFELQRVSLGAIIQDQNRANQLFSEIKSFALKSPVKILDLTKYVKQVAAYRIETDKLFDTTKRLADVSVGLGVDMQRIILFYGQVRAAGYLRASEVRQATEAGIPLVEELAQKLSQARGELVTVGQVMDMISKRQISFQQVAEVFEDLTNKGGIFYNMQEKQGNTLYGMWQKLGDAAQVMYDQIGNTSSVNGALKGSINLLRTLMLNWREVARAILVAGAGFATWKINSAIMAIVVSQTLNVEKALYREIAAEDRLNAAKAMGNKLQIWSATWKLRAAKMSVKAAEANGIWTASMYRAGAGLRSLMASLSAFWPMLLVTAGVAIWQYFDAANEKANRLKKALDEVRESANIEISKSVQNFESLANAAVKARDGSKEQREALEELQTTYGKMIPIQDLQIDKLREMAGNYDLLTEAIRNNIAAQKMQEGITTIIDEYAAKEKQWSDKLRKALVEKGIGYWMLEDGKEVTKSLKITEEQYSRMIANVEKLARTTSMSMRDIWKQVFQGEGFSSLIIDRIDNTKFLQDSNEFIIALRNEENALNDWKKGMRETYPSLEKFADLLTKAKENIKNASITAKEGTFEFDQQQIQISVFAYQQAIAQALKDAKSKIKISDFITVDEGSPEQFMLIDFEGLKKAILDEGGELSRQAHDLVKVIQQEFLGLVPTDPTVRLLRSKLIEITNSFDVVGFGMDKMKQYFWDGSETLKKQVKTWKDELKTMREQIYTYSQTVKALGSLGEWAMKLAGIDISVLTAQADALEKFIAEAEKLVLADEKKGKQSDPRLQILNNIASTMEKINKEYDDLLKKEGETQALADTQRLFAEEFANLQKIANKYKFKLPAFEVPKNASEVKQWYDAIIKEIKRLGIKDADRVLIDLGYKAGKVPIDELQKEIEQKLKDLQSRIEQSKTAREFYDKILSATGDVDIAANVTMSIYGDTGEGLFEQTIAQIRDVFKSGVEGVDIPIDLAFDIENQRINYGKLAQIYEQYQSQLIEANRNTAQKIISEGQKTAAQNILTWEKELAKAKDYEQQRTDIIKQETERRANIIKSNLPEEEKQRQISLSYDLQAQKLADLDVKEFKGSEDFIKMFEDLDNQATSALKRMRDEIQKVIDTDKDMSPENMKAMVDALQKINDELQDRNPFGDMINGAKGMFAAIQQLKTAKDELRQARAEYDAALPSLDADIDTAQKEKDSADEEIVARENDLLAIRQQMAELDFNSLDYETQLAELKERELMAQNNLVAAQLRQNQAQTQLVQAVNAKNKAEEKVTKAQRKATDAQSKAKKEQNKFVKGVQKAGQAIETTKAVLEGLEPILGDLTSEATTMGDVFTAMVNTVQTFTAIMELVIILQEAFNIASESNPWIALAAAILAVTAALAGFISAQKVKKANKIIEEQQKILDQLEYTYSRLQNAADKLFGTDYIQNYNQQIKNLQATAEAYRKQMEAEQSKGKKADEDKLKEYKKSYIETLDEIKDRQKELTDHFLGIDQASAARDFAQAWLEAKVSFENTADAIKSKYKDMIQNMIIEGAAAKVIDNILAPMWDAFNAELGKGNVNKAIEDLINGMDTFTTQADNAMNVLYQSLLAKGYDLQQILGEGDTDFTGIARDIATASEESINGLAQGINTQNYYISHVPTISENVAAIRILMEGGAVAQVGGDYNTLQNEHLAQLPIIAANTLATAERCERAAVACEAMQETIERVVVLKGNNFVVNTRYIN